MPSPLLRLEGVRAGYGESVVLDDVSLEVAEGDSLAVLGRNGAGKSTLCLTIMGFASLSRGRIAWCGADITRLAAHRRARAGLGWVAQERDIFPSLSVEENLTVTARPGRWTLAKAYELFPALAQRRAARGNHLSGGEQQMLAVARALLTNPRLLLLDEPLEGLAPIIVEQLADAIRAMAREEGMALILIEQHVEIALSLTREAMLLERGRVAHRGASAAIAADPALLERFVGLRLENATG
jgi:branched-chain amino acid transport system ATP-binding protein